MIIKGCSLDKDYTSYQEFKERCVIAQGWTSSGDVSFFRDEQRINEYIELIEGKASKKNAFSGIFQIKAGDIFLAFEGGRISGICEVPKNFEYIYQDWDYSNSIFPVNWIDWEDISMEKAPYGYRPPNPIFNIYQSEICSYVINNWEIYKKEHSVQIQLEQYNDELEKIRIEMPFKIEESKQHYIKLLNKKNQMNKNLHYINLLISNKNLILTGAPGTGKTYLAKEIAKQMTGSDINENNSQYAFVQFHPSYDYTDFVEGLRPEKKDAEKEIGFILKDGIFREFCAKAKEDQGNDYVFVIDEINRGEISKIFGELFFSIDPGYRGVKGKVKTQYSNLREEKDQYFYVPENVYIIGTMNDIDRSVESFDFAMRRRFTWIEISANERISMWDDPENGILEWKDKAKNRMQNLNAKIEQIQGLSKAYHVGPAYFLKLKGYNGDFEQLWKNHIHSLLREYLRGMPESETRLIELQSAYNNEQDKG